MLEDGRLTDSKGRVVDFRNTLIILTSNVGAEAIKKNSTLGFTAVTDAGRDYNNMKGKVMDELKKSFRPEFLNRIDEIIVFHSLEEKHIAEIVTLMSDERKRLKEFEVHFELTDKAKAFIAKEGYDPAFGARAPGYPEAHRGSPLRGALKGTVAKGDSLVIDEANGELVVNKNESVTAASVETE